MIKIDGAAIKTLREKQGLTQLYLATSVQVTTDTISRWENRRYPSIKRENGIKLAEALNVPLEELLEKTSEDHDNEDPNPNTAPVVAPPPLAYTLKKTWPLVLLSMFLLTVFIAFLKYATHPTYTATFSAERIIPPHCTSGQPFPILIKINGAAELSTALIIRENIPPNSTVLKVSPKTNVVGSNNKTIKWLKKITGTAVFAYIITVEGDDNEVVYFNGTTAIGHGTESPPATGGNNSTIISRYHWADADKNNIISDNEILAVYDMYSDVSEINNYIDEIEEIWLGSGYRWNGKKSTFEIIE